MVHDIVYISQIYNGTFFPLIKCTHDLSSVRTEHPEESTEFQETVKRLQEENEARVVAMAASLDRQKDVVLEKLEARRYMYI